MALGPRFQAWLLLRMASFKADAAGLDRPVLYAVYGSDIAERLTRIHKHPERDGPDGTLVVALFGRTPAYVRCRFVDEGATLLCEAVVGVYPAKAQAAASMTTAAELKKVGFWPDADGRALFRYEITRDSGIWGGASAVILTPLIDIFGARALSKIEIIAPLAPERDAAAIMRESRRGH